MGIRLNATFLGQNSMEVQSITAAPASTIINDSVLGWCYRNNPTTNATARIISTYVPFGDAAPTTTCFARSDFLTRILPAANDETIFQALTKNASQVNLTLTIRSDGKLQVRDSASAIKGTGAAAIALATKYRWEAMVGFGNPGSWEVRLYNAAGALIDDFSGTGNLNTTAMDSFQLGRGAPLNGNNTVDFCFTNFLWRDDQWCGPGQGAILTPIANGSYANGTAVGAATLWQAVDEVPPDDDTSYVNGFSTGQAFTVRMSGGLSGVVQSVRPFPRIKRDGSSTCLLYTRMIGGGVTTDLGGPFPTPFGQGPNYGNFSFTKCYALDPATNSPWGSSVNSLEAGFLQTNAFSTRCTSVYVFVDYVPTTARPALPISDTYAPTVKLRNAMQTSAVPGI